MNDKEKIKDLRKQIKDLQPNFHKLKSEYDRASKNFHQVSDKIDVIKSAIRGLEKKMKAELYQQKVGKGEVMSFRKFFDRVKRGEDFTNKTIVWSTKNGKSGVAVGIGVENNKVKGKIEPSLDRYSIARPLQNPLKIIDLIKEFPGFSYEDFKFVCHFYISHMNGNRYWYKTIDDVNIFIADKVTLADFDDITKTKGMVFFDHLNLLVESSGRINKDGYLSIGHCGVPKGHWKNYILYPLKAEILDVK